MVGRIPQNRLYGPGLAILNNLAAQQKPPSWVLFDPGMTAFRNTPEFVPLLNRFGLLSYWKTTHTKPDVCSAAGAPPFCRMI